MAKRRVTLIPGDGVGPSIVEAALAVIEAAGAEVEWDRQEAGADVMDKYGTPLPEAVLDNIRENGVAYKGPITTPVASGFRSVNVALRKKLDLYACVRPAFYIEGVRTPYKDIDLVVVRENLEDLYVGIEHMITPDVAESIKVITRAGSERVIRFAFEYVRRYNRNKLTVVHKANIMKMTDGLFLDTARRLSEEYPDVEFEERIVDNMCMQLVQKPHIYDVMVMPNLYGDILSDLCAGLIGGLGIAPSSNLGDGEMAVFEPAHGSAPKYTGMDKVDPTAQILSGYLLLKHIGQQEAAERVLAGVSSVIGEGKVVTYDIGGDAKTSEMARAIVEAIEKG
ncbi:MAG: isocitrate/isopropylmalate dehydrogenase family protein [Actinobacteria bacterium]|nr:isocitrate/isopropylmalate dehydrogenase family protein [Actinomycetota bacterium]MBU4240595.1 isocitrate/isopropylmalate dehydrogenase family protein [Actinomycetota bacterium]MBU4302510.1 isocitrate/isopropylmalate dehydrogenase family protein [Actinomycetota bacterium]MBU4489686.1 isocitrate/isopropylmalate dehydrogenase family protein [Actinomycetota bacterium]MCG2795360.1 isocitrate/isopropylmalate dehydrogenase family protein [Actinomycetes bacterium]